MGFGPGKIQILMSHSVMTVLGLRLRGGAMQCLHSTAKCRALCGPVSRRGNGRQFRHRNTSQWRARALHGLRHSVSVSMSQSRTRMHQSKQRIDRGRRATVYEREKDFPRNSRTATFEGDPSSSMRDANRNLAQRIAAVPSFRWSRR